MSPQLFPFLPSFFFLNYVGIQYGAYNGCSGRTGGTDVGINMRDTGTGIVSANSTADHRHVWGADMCHIYLLTLCMYY